jgi:hypothetical protein
MKIIEIMHFIFGFSIELNQIENKSGISEEDG